MPKFVISNDFIPVSVYFIENFLKEASGSFLKVYLYGLHLAVMGADVDTASIASDLEMLESDVLQAFVYWKNKGLILEENGIVEFCQKPMHIMEEAPKTDKNEDFNKKHYTSTQITSTISQNQDLSELVLLAQELLAKPLSSQELETIYWFYDDLGFSTEAILLLLDYCISRDKRNMRYIEKVAITWHEKGVKTADHIMEYINEEEIKFSSVYKIQKGLGIADRQLSNAEEQYINKWQIKYKMSEEMIMLAYECCLLNTSKLSMPYMDKILERWNNQGIYTKADVEKDNKNFKKKSSNGFNAFEDSFNHEALEELTRNKN